MKIKRRVFSETQCIRVRQKLMMTIRHDHHHHHHHYYSLLRQCNTQKHTQKRVLCTRLCGSFVNHYHFLLPFATTTQINSMDEDSSLERYCILSGVNDHELLAICNKYDTDVSYMPENVTKKTLWNIFAQTVDI